MNLGKTANRGRRFLIRYLCGQQYLLRTLGNWVKCFLTVFVLEEREREFTCGAYLHDTRVLWVLIALSLFVHASHPVVSVTTEME